MKNKYRILKIAVTLVILAFLLNFSLKRFNEMAMPPIDIRMLQGTTPVYFVDEKDIVKLVNQANPTNKVGDIDIPKLERSIKALEAVDSANVYLSLDGILHLDIKQRIPIFRLHKGNKSWYVDEQGVAFPTQRNFAYPCMLVSGNIPKEDYPQLINLIKTINQDSFSKQFFIGISKYKNDYNLVTNNGNYKVEIGDLDHIDFKIKGFKAFVEKYLVYQSPEKYSKISVKYDNQIVTTLNPRYKEQKETIEN